MIFFLLLVYFVPFLLFLFLLIFKKLTLYFIWSSYINYFLICYFPWLYANVVVNISFIFVITSSNILLLTCFILIVSNFSRLLSLLPFNICFISYWKDWSCLLSITLSCILRRKKKSVDKSNFIDWLKNNFESKVLILFNANELDVVWGSPSHKDQKCLILQMFLRGRGEVHFKDNKKCLAHWLRVTELYQEHIKPLNQQRNPRSDQGIPPHIQLSVVICKLSSFFQAALNDTSSAKADRGKGTNASHSLFQMSNLTFIDI